MLFESAARHSGAWVQPKIILFGRRSPLKRVTLRRASALGVEAGGLFPKVDHNVLLLRVVLKHDLVGFTPDA